MRAETGGIPQEIAGFRKQVLDMKPYSPPIEARMKEDYLRLDFNERTTPPHPLVQEAVMDYVRKGDFQIYPAYGDLDNIIAGYMEVNPSEVIPTNGSDEAIDIVYRVLVKEGDDVIIPIPTFAMLEQSAHIQGANIISPRYNGPNLDFPYEEVMQAIKPGIKLVIICNPNNPTGTTIPKEQSEAVIRKAAEVGADVMIDEAYHEFAPELTVVGLIKKYPNLFVTRSFSKTMGIAALRAGCVVSQSVKIAELRKVRSPYSVNMTAVAAMRALIEPKVVEDIRSYVSEVMTVSKPMLETFYRENGVEFFPSGAGFHLLEAPGLYDYLEEKKILVRKRPDPVGTVRVSIGTEEDTRKYIEAFQGYLKATRK